MFIYGVRDRKRGKFGYFYTDEQNDSAMRSFLTACNDKNTLIGLYPEDFELYNLGELNTITGEIEPLMIYIDTGRRTNESGRTEILFKTEQTENDAE